MWEKTDKKNSTLLTNNEYKKNYLKPERTLNKNLIVTVFDHLATVYILYINYALRS